MCSMPTITGGSVKPRREKIGDGHSYTVKCAKENTLTGSATILCTAGSLSTAPTCPPTREFYQYHDCFTALFFGLLHVHRGQELKIIKFKELFIISVLASTRGDFGARPKAEL